MTVSAQTPINRSTANGVTTVFPYNFKVLAAADLEVSLDGVVKTLTTDYTLSGVGDDAGGNVTMLSAPANGVTVVRRRNMAYIREVDYQDQGELPTDTLDDDQDAPILMIQQVAEGLSRAVSLPPESSSVSLELPTPGALQYLRWNAAADALESVLLADVSLISLTAYAQTLLNAVDAAAARVVLGITTFGSSLVTAANADAARTAMGAAASGANSDITSLTGLTQVRGLSPTQTVLSGPVDSSGFSAFGGSVGTATLTTAATLKVAAAAGGDLSYVGSITNAAFTSPGGSGTGYLCLSVTSAGVVTAAVRTLQRVEQWGGTYSITNGQLTFNIQEMTHKVGSGAAATQVYEVVIGECPYTAGVWSGTPVWYALNAQASIAQTLAAATVYSLSHNMGSRRAYLQAYMVADDGTSSYPIPLYSMDNTDTGPVYAGVTGVGLNEKTIGFKTATTGLFANNVSVAVNFGTASAARINVKRWW